MSIWPFFSLTRLVIDFRKHGKEQEEKADILRSWNVGWFAMEAATALLFLASTLTVPKAPVVAALQWVAVLLAFWRINEIVYAFWADVLDSTRGVPRTSALTPTNRLTMLARSTGGLVVWFAVIYWVLSYSGGFKCPLNHFGDALYFSAVTLLSIGQEGQEVESAGLRIAQIYQGVAGFTLLALAVSTYLGQQRTGDA